MAEEKIPYYRPSLKPDDVQNIVQKLYGLDVIVVREFDSYDDQNFHVKENPGISLESRELPVCPDGYVFKILNSRYSQKPDHIDMQTKIIAHASAAGYPTPAPIVNNDNRYQELIHVHNSESPGGNKDGYVVRLFEFMPGMTLDQVTLTNQLCYEIGLYASKLDVVLKDFPDKDSPTLLSITNQWNMSEIPKLRSKVHTINSQEQQDLIMEIIDRFEREILMCQQKFSKGLIHGDFNDCNILVTATDDTAQLQRKKGGGFSQNISDGAATSSQEFQNHADQDVTSKLNNSQDEGLVFYHLSGIIDFGDTTHSLYLFEISIAIVYVMVNTHGIPPMKAASHVLGGYLKHIPLTDYELWHIKICILARFAQSLVLGYFSASQDPGNNYILKHAKRIWPVLKSLWSTEDSLVLQQLMEFVDAK